MAIKMRGKDNMLLLMSTLLMALSVSSSWAQRSPFSLQTAVDELHRQEYPLNAPPPVQQPHFMAGAFGSSPDQDYWEEEAAYAYNAKKPRSRLNKQLAKYLERESYDADHGGLTLGPFGGYEFDEDSNKLILPSPYQDDRNKLLLSSPYQEDRKRSSVFRERSNLYDDTTGSLFREREAQELPEHSELTDQFLREIERAQEHERQDRYKEALRSLWEKYQQQENQIDGDIYEEQKKRMRMPPYYMLMQKKRSYPVLPWLPYNGDRKKRFPVSKRSTAHMTSENALSNLEKTDENVERELSELFGTGTEEKKKRSIDSSHTKAGSDHDLETQAISTDMRLEMDNAHENKTATQESEKSLAGEANHQQNAEHHQHVGHSLKEHKHGKRSNHGTSHESHEDDGEDEDDESNEEHDSEEEEEEHDHEHEHDGIEHNHDHDGHEHDHDHDGHEHDHGHDGHDGHEENDEEAKRKKKRNAGAGTKKKRNIETLRHSIDDFNIMRSKKSINWSNYFGLDRKKKAMPTAVEDNKDDDMKKRNANEDTAESADDDTNKKKKRRLDPAKLDNMNKKLQAIEDFIINETIKYTGAHEGIDNPEEIQRLKDRVLSRLATAYSLEKMRRALEKLRQSVDNENHLMRNIVDNEIDNSLENNSLEAVKKAKKSNSDADEDKDAEAMKKKMKKSNGFMRYPDVANDFNDFEDTLQSPSRYETLNDAYLGNKNYILGTNQCPIIESMAERCRGVDLLSGDVNQELLPLCGVHQLCYLCGTSQIACDYQYLSEADAECGNNNNECQAAARSVLMILRGTPGPQLGPRECIKNSCLYSAMREIGL